MKMFVFGTCYAPTNEKVGELMRWIKLLAHLNPDSIDCLLIDSNSIEAHHDRHLNPLIGIYRFPDNIGHLSRGGRDGWGRAFSMGLQYAIDHQYDYAVHIEGDSLFRLPVKPICEQMAQEGIKVASVPVGYGEAQRSTWVETGLMFFDVEYLRTSNFIAGYDWPNRTAKPQPEIVIRRMLGDDLVMLPLKAERSDRGEITVDNVTEYDWITHCRPEVYDRFVESVLG